MDPPRRRPSKIDWAARLPKSIQVEHVQTRTFPWRDVQHEITWWITGRIGVPPVMKAREKRQ